VEVRKTIDHVELIVCDTGPRIAPDGHAKGLEPLYRTLGTNTTGSGLGLPIVQAIATHTGATIQLEYVDESAQTGLPVRVSLLQGNKELASAAFNARVIPSVAYTDPEVAWVGLTEDQAKRRASRSRRACSPGRPRAAPLPTAATKASPSCCSTTAPKQDQETAMLAGATARSWAAAWSARMRAT
jgi:dihydrolipoamide dehydrogenase